jgi:hypothetical protein
LKLGGEENYNKAMECYQEASAMLQEMCGDLGMDFYLSLVDIGDVYLELK